MKKPAVSNLVTRHDPMPKKGTGIPEYTSKPAVPKEWEDGFGNCLSENSVVEFAIMRA